MNIRVISLLMAGVAFGATAALPLWAGDETAGPSPYVFVPDAASASVFVPSVQLGVADEGQADPAVLSTANTDSVVSILQSGQAFCASLPQDAYSVDCLAERMAAAAAAMPDTGEYADARKALAEGAARLNALVVANADPAKPRVTARQPTEGGIRTTRPLVPVRAEAQAEVAVQAQQILDETATILLRSSESSSERKVHYERIAAAVDSNKVLLRSL